MVRDEREMWLCPNCHRRFANHNQVHHCHALGSVEDHLANCLGEVRATYERFVEVVEALGPVEVLAQRTRIAFHARMSFAVLIPRRRWLNGHLVFAERVDDPRFTSITTYSARNHVHEFRLSRPADIDADLRRWIGLAYSVGMQQHHQDR